MTVPCLAAEGLSIFLQPCRDAEPGACVTHDGSIAEKRCKHNRFKVGSSYKGNRRMITLQARSPLLEEGLPAGVTGLDSETEQ